MMEKLIRQRKKLCPVKMEYSRVLDEKIIHNLCKELNLNHEQIYYSESPLELSFVFGLQDALRNNKNLFMRDIFRKIHHGMYQVSRLFRRLKRQTDL